MKQLELYFLWFVMYSVIGWVYESIVCSIDEKKLVNRGFLNGPYCPIYGCGAVVDIMVLGNVENPVLLFVLGMLMTGVLEYFTSWAMEKLFHARWWDYSDKKFNINGRVCLLGAVVFGTLSVVLIKFLHPYMASLTGMLSDKQLDITAAVAFGIILADSIYTISRFLEFEKILSELSGHLDDAVQSMKALYERVGTSYRGKLHKSNSQVRRMIATFPSLKSTSARYNEIYNETLQKLRTLMSKENRHGRKNK